MIDQAVDQGPGQAAGQVATMKRPNTQLVAATPTSMFPFLSLPPEIRNMIYKYLLHFDNPIKPPSLDTINLLREYERKHKCRISGSALRIARVCRQMKDETLPIYFGNNVFEFSSVRNITTFMQGVGEERRNMITNISFTYYGRGVVPAFTALGECAKLRQLNVNVMCFTTGGPGNDDLTSVPGLKKLLKIRGCTEVTITYEDGSTNRYSEDNRRKFEKMLKNELCKPKVEPKRKTKKTSRASKDLCSEEKGQERSSGKDKKTVGAEAKAPKSKGQGKTPWAATSKTTKAGAKGNKTLAVIPEAAK